MKPCETCGKLIEERTDREVRFCSRECFGKSCRKPRPEKVCPVCEEAFQPSSKHPKQTYCSVECRDNRGGGIGERQSGETRRISAVERRCSECGTLVLRPGYRAHFETCFCSPECTSAYRKKHTPRGQDHPNWKRVELNCATCGETVYRKPSHIGDHVFCCHECSAKYRRENDCLSGPDHPLWNGGVGDYYYGPNWLQQRRNARHRDQYHCRSCGLSEDDLGRQLDVHHVIPFRHFSEDNYAIANRLRNLISLCNSCHKRIEHGITKALSA